MMTNPVRSMAVLIALLMPEASLAAAAHLYIAQIQTGNADGSRCEDAVSLSFFNDSRNWRDGGPIGPGTTIHICGTLSAPAMASDFLFFRGSGAAGNPITLLWERDATVESPAFRRAVNLGGNSHLVLDGGGSGSIRNTANGTGLARQDTSVALYSEGGTNITVRNLTIGPLYLHLADPNDPTGDGNYGLQFTGGSQVTIGPGNHVRDARYGILFGWYDGDRDLRIFGNQFTGNNTSIAVGALTGRGRGGTITNIAIHDNVINGWANWDEASGRFHHTAFVHWANAPGTASAGELSFHNNYCYGDMGRFSTSVVEIGQRDGGRVGAWNIFNNVIAVSRISGHGLIYSLAQNTNVYNNTLIGPPNTPYGIGVDLHASGGQVFNNVFDTVGTPIRMPYATQNEFDSNLYQSAVNWHWNGSWYKSLSAWRTACACDSRSSTSDAQLLEDYRLGAASAAIGGGDNLTNLGVRGLGFDKSGFARPASGAWDAGAYQYRALPPVPPEPPAGLAATVRTP